MLLLIDNYDSFAHNLARYFNRLGQRTRVVRNDAIDVAGIRSLSPSAIVISPGPCTPDQAGCSLAVVRQFASQLPILGVCLGHQTIAAALGGKVIRSTEPVHGRASLVHHTGQHLFAGLPNPLTVGRYHSLVVDPSSLPDELEVTATTSDGVVMAITHRRWPVFGLQFHPESILTEQGYELLAQFLREAGIASEAGVPSIDSEYRPIARDTFSPPAQPVTF